MSLACFEIVCGTVDNPGKDGTQKKVNVIELNIKNRRAYKIAENLGVGKTQGRNILKRKAEVL